MHGELGAPCLLSPCMGYWAMDQLNALAMCILGIWICWQHSNCLYSTEIPEMSMYSVSGDPAESITPTQGPHKNVRVHHPSSSAEGSGFGACGQFEAFGTHGLLRPVPLTTGCWPEAPSGGGGGANSHNLHCEWPHSKGWFTKGHGPTPALPPNSYIHSKSIIIPFVVVSILLPTAT